MKLVLQWHERLGEACHIARESDLFNFNRQHRQILETVQRFTLEPKGLEGLTLAAVVLVNMAPHFTEWHPAGHPDLAIEVAAGGRYIYKGNIQLWFCREIGDDHVELEHWVGNVLVGRLQQAIMNGGGEAEAFLDQSARHLVQASMRTTQQDFAEHATAIAKLGDRLTALASIYN